MGCAGSRSLEPRDIDRHGLGPHKDELSQRNINTQGEESNDNSSSTTKSNSSVSMAPNVPGDFQPSYDDLYEVMSSDNLSHSSQFRKEESIPRHGKLPPIILKELHIDDPEGVEKKTRKKKKKGNQREMINDSSDNIETSSRPIIEDQLCVEDLDLPETKRTSEDKNVECKQEEGAMDEEDQDRIPKVLSVELDNERDFNQRFRDGRESPVSDRRGSLTVRRLSVAQPLLAIPEQHNETSDASDCEFDVYF